jgi:hypothetical protein
VARSIWGDLSLLAAVAVGLLVLGFAWSPALLRSRRLPDDGEPWLEELEKLSDPPAYT